MHDVITIQPHLIIIPGIGFSLALIGALFFFGFDRWFRGSYGFDGWMFGGVILWICAGIMAMVWTIALIPFDSKYHVVYKLEGRVDSVTNDWDKGSGLRTSTPIVSLSGYDDPIYVNDSRIVSQKGKEVTLTCTLEWSQNAMDVTRCTIAEIKK